MLGVNARTIVPKVANGIVIRSRVTATVLWIAVPKVALTMAAVAEIVAALASAKTMGHAGFMKTVNGASCVIATTIVLALVNRPHVDTLIFSIQDVTTISRLRRVQEMKKSKLAVLIMGLLGGLMILVVYVSNNPIEAELNLDSRDLSVLIQLPFDEALAAELKNDPELLRLWKERMLDKSRTDDKGKRASNLEEIIPLFRGALASVRMCETAAQYYADARRFPDARRIAETGIGIAEEIIKNYPNAVFLAHVHYHTAVMYTLLSSPSKVEKQKAVAHLDNAIQLNPDTSLYSCAMLLKGMLLAELGEESASMQIFDKLLKAPNTSLDTRMGAELGRVNALVVLGKRTEAIEELERLIRENPPGSEIVRRASKRLGELDGSEIPAQQ